MKYDEYQHESTLCEYLLYLSALWLIYLFAAYIENERMIWLFTYSEILRYQKAHSQYYMWNNE